VTRSAFEIAMKPSAIEAYMRHAERLNKIVSEPTFVRLAEEATRFQTSRVIDEVTKINGLDPKFWSTINQEVLLQTATRVNKMFATPGLFDRLDRASRIANQVSARMTFPNLWTAHDLLEAYASSLPGAVVAAETLAVEEVGDDVLTREPGWFDRLPPGARLILALALNDALQKLVVVLADALDNDDIRKVGNALALATAFLFLLATIRQRDQL
jgi:hypothetical protein